MAIKMFTIITSHIVTYAASVWWLKTKQKAAITKLHASVIATAPIAPFKVMLHLPPFHIFIKREARCNLQQRDHPKQLCLY